MNPQDFKYDNNYDIRANFSRVKYGANRGLLETELNEMQKIQEETRASLIRKIVPSGFVELKRADIIGNSIISYPNNIMNSIGIAPCKAFINGYEASIEGNEEINGVQGWLSIEMPPPPISFYRIDFVFLEFWFQELDENSAIRKHGYESGIALENKLVDERINEETSHRVGLRWRVRIEQNLDFNKWSDGFGYNSDTDFSPIFAYGAKGQKVDNIDYTFRPATDNIFKDCSFYCDNGLWVAGRPTSLNTNTDLKIVENYVYAVPLAKVRRRNNMAYSIDNPNGASLWENQDSISTHPDGLFYNKIELSDVTDLRRSISFSGWDYNTMLEKTLKNVVNGGMETKANEIMHRIQFGVPALTKASNPNIIFISKFGDNATTEDDVSPRIILGDQDLKYGFGAIGDGLVLNGESAVEYDITGFNKQNGAIDFFFKPFWNSADKLVTQTLFSFIDIANNNKAFEFKKSGTNLTLTIRMNSTGGIGSSYDLPIDLGQNIIRSKKVHHIRISWDFISKSVQVFLNGKQVVANSYNGTSLNPSVIRVGEIETIDNNLTFRDTVIDEIVIYNQPASVFTQLKNDFIQEESTIYPSFNGYLNSFFDSSYEQTDFVEELTVISAGNSAVLNAPYGILISTDIPKVYSSNGSILSGTWSGLGSNQATFTLSAGNFGTTKIYVQHNLLISAGNGIFELPTAVIKADLNGKEASFNKANSTQRQVKLLQPRVTVGQTDVAYDFSTNRTDDQCFARLLYYYIEGDGQNRYYLPPTLYGYEVIGVKSINRPYNNIRKIYNDNNKSFELELTQALIKGQNIEVQVYLGGLSFDYQIHNKGVISNTIKTSSIVLTAPGNTNTFSVRVDTNGGYNLVLASLVSFKNEYDSNGEVTGVSKKYVSYIDGLETEVLSITGYNTPFLNFTFNFTPLIGQKIEIPILASYSPTTSDIISIWLKNVPYQGDMDSSSYKLKRVSNWLQFTTTLSSGNIVPTSPLPVRSINNAFNRLPGGGSFTHVLTAQPIKIETDNPISLYSGLNPNNYFITFRDTRNILVSNDLDSYFVELDDEFVVKKGQSNFQDGKLEAPFSLYGFYLPDTVEPINKYSGASALVVSNTGELMLFLFGYAHDFKSTTSNIAKPVYGDLFHIAGRPTILSRS